ncbi:MAG TPA: hypothetical protein VL403_12030 [Candidatus Kryptonia bacterium]|nr:hypothetical protein [Candidatus Kryptonia bacterium]
MRKVRWASWTVAVAAVLLAGAPGHVRADVTSDKAAAIVIFPIVNVGGPFATDTLIQLSNTSTNPVEAHCFYLNANGHCTNSGGICATGAQCCTGGSCGLCLPGWNETDFRIFITARQPLAWTASDGLSSFCTNSPGDAGEPCIPLDGTARKGPKDPTDPTGQRFQSNAGTRIPPVAEVPFVGELKCIAVDSSGDPLSGPSANVLKGEASLENVDAGSPGRLDVGKYNGIGIRALDNPNDDGIPSRLVLQTNGGEYEGCPNVLVLDHFFDSAQNPVPGVAPTRRAFTWPVFVPCTEDLLKQVPGTSIAQYLVFNEFEQRFSTSNTIQCFRATALSFTDTTQPQNSIFNAGVTGTLTGQTRVSPLGSGLVAVALEFWTTASTTNPVDAIVGSPADPIGEPGQQDDVNVHYQSSSRPSPDIIQLP